jgi:hypothetical protein
MIGTPTTSDEELNSRDNNIVGHKYLVAMQAYVSFDFHDLYS